MKKAVALIQKKEKKKKVDGSRAWSKTVLFWEKGRAAYYGLFCCIEKKIPPPHKEAAMIYLNVVWEFIPILKGLLIITLGC